MFGVKQLSEYLHHRPTKLWEGNVFSHVCLYTGGSHVSITHDTLKLAIQPPQLGTSWTPLASDIWWPSLETCSYLFSSGPHTSADIWWLLKQVWSAQVGGMHATGMLFCSWKVFGRKAALQWGCNKNRVSPISFFPRCVTFEINANKWQKTDCHNLTGIILTGWKETTIFSSLWYMFLFELKRET